MIKTYSEMIKFDSFYERFEYLKLNGYVGEDTFGNQRFLNQILYKTPEWRKIRREIILRDNGMDLGVTGCTICGKVLIHHINPITIEDIQNRNFKIFDPENLVCVSHKTHNTIHYGNIQKILNSELTIRSKNDTIPWKK